MDEKLLHQSKNSVNEHYQSNQRILMITCASFLLFVIAEIIGALASNSLSLLGDASAMSVDVFTYFTNMCAERIKSTGKPIDRQTQIFLDIVIPSFSVCALLGVTGWITSEAIGVIQSNGEGDDDVNVYFLYGFAAANFVVDVVSSLMFYFKRNSVFAHFRILSDEVVILNLDLEVTKDVDNEETEPLRTKSTTEKLQSNLNMLSAFTHVGGDTLRTVAVFFAAVIATATDVPGNICDAWASIVVTITIICCVIPLILEIIKSAQRHFGNE